MHKIAEGDSGAVFRYRPGRLRLLLFCAPWPVLFVILFYIFLTPKPRGIDLLPYLLVGILPAVLLLASYVSMRKFSIEDRDDCLVVNRLGGSRSVEYRDIERIVFNEGFGRSSSNLSAYAKGGRRIFSVTNSFDDILSLAGLLKSRAAKYGALYQRRDKYGNYS